MGIDLYSIFFLKSAVWLPTGLINHQQFQKYTLSFIHEFNFYRKILLNKTNFWFGFNVVLSCFCMNAASWTS